MSTATWGQRSDEGPEARFLEGPRPRGSELLWALGAFAELIRSLALVGRDFWRPLTGFLHGPLESMGLIDPVDADRIVVTDSAADAVTAVPDTVIDAFDLHYARPRRRWLLRE